MNCSDCQDLLSEFIDNDLTGSRRTAVREHLKSCYDCNLICEDLNQIVLVSRELPMVAPQNALWSRIEREIKGLTRLPQRRPSFWSRFWGYRLQMSLSMPQLAGGVLGLMMILLAATISYRPEQIALKTQEVAINFSHATIIARPLANVMDPEEAELRGAIDRLTQAVDQRRAKWDPKMQEMLERNLVIVDRSVAECRQLVLRNPNDQIAHEMMIVAYKEKLRLLEQFSSL